MLQVTPDSLHDIGWPHVLAAVADQCATELGRDGARNLALCEDAGDVRATLAAVSELMRHQDRGGSLPLGDVHDVSDVVARCSRGGVADAESLVRVAATAHCLRDLRREIRHHAEDMPVIADLASSIEDLGPLAAELGGTFDEAGEVRDDASPELRDARRRLASLHQNTKSRLERYLRSEEIEGVLQDTYYTVRDDRYVLPVISSMQSQVPGIIHGSSHTAQTAYIEPAAFIEANNAIKLAEADAFEALRKVLAERSAWVADDGDALLHAVSLAVSLDLLQARARFAVRHAAVCPAISDDGDLHLGDARNPLLVLKGSTVVPNTITLTPDHTFVVITGPNTGGKTVTLNTVALAATMTHAGIPVLAAPDSRVPLFTALHAVIGDAQDIQSDLSTFSGHLRGLQRVLDSAAPGTLVLLDEIAVGTEPERGAALAIAVLEALADRGARGFVTTHYPRLKALPLEDDRFANASVGVDPRTLEPTFELAMGAAGASSPFETAARLGFDADVLVRARAISVGHGGLAEAIAKLEEARGRAEAAEAEAEASRRAAEAEGARLAIDRERLRREAAAEIARIHATIRAEADEALATIREQVRDVQSERDPRALERRRRKVVASREISDQAADALKPAPGAKATTAPTPPKRAPSGPRDGGDLAAVPAVGDAVWVRMLGKPGDVVEVRGKSLVVAVGGLKLTVDAAKVGAVAGVTAASATAAARKKAAAQTADYEPDMLRPLPQTEDTTLDLRGCRRDEVSDQLEVFLDRCYRMNREVGWVIHGHGTGAIRDEVRSLLKSSPYVIDFRGGQRGEGGDGVTIAWLERS